MRIERGRGDGNEARHKAASAAAEQALAATFMTALRRHRVGERSEPTDPRRSEDAASRRGTNPSSHRKGSTSSIVARMPDMGPDTFLEALATLPRLFSPLPPMQEPRADALVSTAAPRDMRRRRGPANDDPSPCIEIAHASSGMRFLLSRQDGVWLLSLLDQPTAADAHSVIETLRAHFAANGLGPIDVVI